MTEKPTALRLADCLEGSAKTPWTREEAAAELRRQHAEIEQLREQNTILDATCTKLDMVRDELLKHLEDINPVGVQRGEFEALAQAAERETLWREIHDAVVKDSDKAYELLRWAETEMRYAGWAERLADNAGRADVYEAIADFLK